MYNKQMEDYLASKKMYSMEGGRGVTNMETVMREVCGYDSSFSGVMANFFQDNPGAIEAVVEWIGKQALKGDWKDNLESLVGPAEEDEVGDLAPPEETASSDPVDDPRDFVVRGYK